MNFALFNWIVLLARLTIALPKEEPQQKTQDGQQHDEVYPDQFFLVGHRALKNVENGPNSAASISRPMKPLYPKFIISGSFCLRPKSSMRAHQAM
jgi:hypothetical protein